MKKILFILPFLILTSCAHKEAANHDFVVVEGDIIVGKGQQGLVLPKVFTWNKWPRATVPYVINKNVPNPQRILDAIAHFHENTNIKFVPRTTQAGYVSFQHWNGGYCWSWIGYTGKAQEVMLDPACDKRSVIHELGHAVGLWHEHTRTDRDKYVKIILQNVQKGLESNFVPQKTNAELVGKYDYESVMHYRWWELSGNGKPTVTKLDGSIDGLSNPYGLSVGDIAALKYIYPTKGNNK